MIFKVEAQGDTLYFKAPHQSDALRQLEEICGPIPSSLLKWSQVKKLPKDAEISGD
jgi:hypothetical protein